MDENNAVAAVVAEDAAEADDAGTMDLKLLHMRHDWAGVADAGHEGVERVLMWGMMMADSQKSWERRTGRKRNGQQNLVVLSLP